MAEVQKKLRGRNWLVKINDKLICMYLGDFLKYLEERVFYKLYWRSSVSRWELDHKFSNTDVNETSFPFNT
jgi:hypothetical protein